MENGIWIIDAQARTLYANDRMAEILGATRPELVGGSSLDYVFDTDRDAAERLFAKKMQGDIDPFKFQLRRRDGSGVWVDVQGTPMRDASGQFLGIVGTFAVIDDAPR